MINDKFVISVYFNKEHMVTVSCKGDKELEEAFNKIETSKWFRTKDYSGETLVLQTSNITYLRVTEYMVSTEENEEDEDFIKQGEDFNLW
ncbi:hypothetical protein D3C76_275970 [compost metagenome]